MYVLSLRLVYCCTRLFSVYYYLRQGGYDFTLFVFLFLFLAGQTHREIVETETEQNIGAKNG